MHFLPYLLNSLSIFNKIGIVRKLSDWLQQCIPNCVSRHTGVSPNILGVSRDFSYKAKNDQFFETCSKKCHETQFLHGFVKNIFFGVSRNFFDSKVCRQPKKFGRHWATI